MSNGGEAKRLAPVTFLPGVTPVAEPAVSPQIGAPLFGEAPARAVAFSEEYWSDESAGDTAEAIAAEIDEPVDRERVVADASEALARSLGRRGLSIAEVRAKLRTSGLTPDESSAMVDDFTARGWLDDAALAEQLIHSATTRKDMGTRAIRQLLVKRLVAREVIDAAIAELPDDDAQRALELARTKARTLVRYDDATATRRLMGMLARRGFGGSVAGSAARTALADARRESGATGRTGPRFR